MIEGWREFLYPLGFLSALTFGGRALLQWTKSEIAQKSVVTASFWHLSLLGNFLLLLHSFIQVQYHVCVIQACNAVIAWRNLNLLKPQSAQVKRSFVIGLLISAILLVTTLFLLIGDEWFRIPLAPWQKHLQKPVNPLWHLTGFIGMILFASRFWIQWWCAEKYKVSYLGRPFWWLSLVGDLLTLLYFIRIEDSVNIVGPVFGLIPYVRNLMLLYKTPKIEI